MQRDGGLSTFGEVIQGIYNFMQRIQIPVFGVSISLWYLFLFGLVGGVVVWFIKRLFD